MRRSMRATLLTVVVALFLGITSASAQTLKVSLESHDIYANMPFVLSASAHGFDETPEPEEPSLTIPGVYY